MRDKPSEWVSISDLMAGVMAVVMLLLVMSVLQKTYAELKHKQELEQGGAAQQKRISEMLTDLKSSVDASGASNLISFDIADGKIKRIVSFLRENPNASVYVEGHTDNSIVKQPVLDFKEKCTVYDDNFTLSAARAREARKLLISNLTEDDARRVIVAGYGDSRPLNGIDPSDGRNRRVEIQFAVSEGK